MSRASTTASSTKKPAKKLKSDGCELFFGFLVASLITANAFDHVPRITFALCCAGVVLALKTSERRAEKTNDFLLGFLTVPVVYGAALLGGSLGANAVNAAIDVGSRLLYKATA